MKKFLLLTIASLLVTVQASNKQGDGVALEFEQVEKDMRLTTEQSSKGFVGLDPVAGRNLMSVLITDIANIFFNPSWISITAFWVDLIQFLFTPLIGGVVNASVLVNYEKDAITYQHAGLDKSYLYSSSMIFAKDAIYSAMGRPDFYDTENEYEAAREPSEVANFP